MEVDIRTLSKIRWLVYKASMNVKYTNDRVALADTLYEAEWLLYGLLNKEK